MSNQKLTKLQKHPDATWALLQKRLIQLPDPFANLFPEEVWTFFQRTAESLSMNAAYVTTTLLTTTAYVAGMSTTLISGAQEMPLRLFTGKSQAIKECAVNPMTAVTMENDSYNGVINKCTSSGLVKTITTNQKGYLLSPEIYDVLFKLLKSDKENATGNIQVLCQLFSGEATSYTYATENVRQITQNTPFCVLGSTQVPFAARLVTLIDQGQGLLDRFLVTFPKCLRPTPLQTNQALEYLEQRPIRSCNDIFIEIARLHSTCTTYTLDRESREIVDLLNEEFIAEINDAITEGRTPPKTKKVDIILRIAITIHIFTHVTTELLNERQPGMPEGEVGKETLHRAINYVKWAESQKEIFVEVINVDIDNLLLI